VEVKSGWAPPVPFDSHAMQLAAYCLLVERDLGVRPPYGLLRYRNRTFRLAYTDEIRERVLDMIFEVRRAKRLETVDRSHEHQARCARCSFRSVCDQRL
jgi:CRISPR-associated exonuclease Cas4